MLLGSNPVVKTRPDCFISSAATGKSRVRANIHRVDGMSLPVGSPQRISISHIWISARMMTAVKERVAPQPQRMSFDLFVVFGVVDPGPSNCSGGSAECFL